MSRRASAETTAAVARLWDQFQRTGCVKARDALVEHYSYLVPKTRQRALPNVPIRVQPEDLDQEGRMALVRAVEQFDPRRKVKFESYAITRIRGAILEYLRRDDWVPRSVREKQKRLKQAEEELTLRCGGQAATDEERAAHLTLSLDAFYQLYFEACVLHVVALEHAAGEGEPDDPDPLAVLESVASTDPDPHILAVRDSQRGLLMRCVDWLPAAERSVVQLYYYEGLKLREIAERIGKSESRVHQLHKAAVERLAGLLAREQGLFVAESLPCQAPAERVTSTTR